jgi:hypothetical protein
MGYSGRNRFWREQKLSSHGQDQQYLSTAVRLPFIIAALPASRFHSQTMPGKRFHSELNCVSPVS